MWNTRCMKHESGVYEIRLASALTSNDGDAADLPELKQYEHKDHKFSVTRGDYSGLMERVCDNLRKASVSVRILNVESNGLLV